VAEAEELKTLLRGGAAATTQPTTRSAMAERYVQALEPTEPERFLRQPSLIRNLGFSRSPHDKVFALVDEAGPAESAEKHRVVVVPLARSLKWAVIELLEVKPIYRGEFELQRNALQQQNARVVSQSFLISWFDPDNIIRRTGYVPAAPAQNAEKAEADPASE
jgi:hypothetical protein